MRLPGFAALRALVVGFGVVGLLLLSGCKSELFGALDETDANTVLHVLYAEGVTAEKAPADGGLWRVSVDEADLQRALYVAQQAGVPRERFANMGELFKKEGLVSSPSEERLRYIFAVSQELSATLSQIDGVVSARVHPVIPANDPLADKVRLSSAAVFIKHKADADLQVMAPAIKNLVTRSIEGLTSDQVSLVFVATRVQPVSAPVTSLDNTANRKLIVIASVLALSLALALAGLGLIVRRLRASRTAAWELSPQQRSAHGVVRPL